MSRKPQQQQHKKFGSRSETSSGATTSTSTSSGSKHGGGKKGKGKKRQRRGVASSGLLEGVRDKKLRRRILETEKANRDAERAASKMAVLLPEEAGLLEAEGPLGRTYKFSQKEIAGAVDLNTRRKIIDLKLDRFGPYGVDFSRNGRHMLLAGRKGHVAMLDWHTLELSGEVHLRETVRDCTFLHTHKMFAVAQKKYVYIYDETGMEIHCLRSHMETQRLDFLPYHYLLVSVGRTGYLKYQDVSTGDLICEHRTKLGSCNVMRQNPSNAIMCLGHHNGVVTMWSPNMTTPLVKMFCHHGNVRALAVDGQGRYMATTGADGQMKIWDLRTYKTLQSYFTTTPGASLDISQRGLLAVGHGPHVQVWKDCFERKQKAPYMRHSVPGSAVGVVRFRPYEDALGIAHASGVASIVVPGSGEPNFDAYEANPFETSKQRREGDVHKILEKLRPDMIVLAGDGDAARGTGIGTVERAPREVVMKERKAAWEASNPGKVKKEKKRMRGRNKIGKKQKKRQANIMTLQKAQLKDKMEQEARKKEIAGDASNKANAPRSALSRFME